MIDIHRLNRMHLEIEGNPEAVTVTRLIRLAEEMTDEALTIEAEERVREIRQEKIKEYKEANAWRKPAGEEKSQTKE